MTTPAPPVTLAPFATTDDYATNIGPITARTQLDLDAASDAIREYCGWNIYPQVTETITVDGSGTSVLLLPTMNLTADGEATPLKHPPASLIEVQVH